MVEFLNSGQSAQWRSYLNRLPPELSDIHFYPELMKPYEATGLGEGMLLVEEQGNEFYIQPMLKTKDGKYHHPYNFGGPIATPGFTGKLIEFPNTCTLNPFLSEHQNNLLGGKAKHVKDAVWLDLTKPIELRQTTRHTAEKAAKAGVRVEPVKLNDGNIAIFFNLYSKHMEKVGALPHWKFPELWFNYLIKLLPGNAHLLFAKENDINVVGACLLLQAHGTCYYHFASISFRSPYGTSHRMVVSAAEFARDYGCERFHLGGGITPNDGLYKFKAGFSDLRLPVYKYESVSDDRDHSRSRAEPQRSA